MRSTLSLAPWLVTLAWSMPALITANVAWTQETGESQTAPADEVVASDEVSTIQDMAQGAEEAPVTVIEYGSFTCPHCAAWHEESYQQLKDDYIDTGKVRFVFREVYFDRPGLWASMIARCGGEMRFFGIHDMIFEQQREWIGDQQPANVSENLRSLGRVAGLDDDTMETCLTNGAQAEALVAWFQQNAEADKIDSTPTFIINGEKYSNMAWEEMQAIIDTELAEAGQ
jgi:protein-disulfide isomerase